MTPTNLEVDPAATLRAVSLTDADAADGYTFVAFPGGDEVKGRVSLDVCSKTFSTESLRVARHQVGIVDATNHGAVSTEALLYKDEESAAKAMDELRAAVADCPTTPTKGPVADSPALSYVVNAPPDASWQPTAGVDRFAVDLTATATTGESRQMTGAFLQRGRLLLAIYTLDPTTASASLAGNPTLEALSNRFATEIAALPAEQVQ